MTDNSFYKALKKLFEGASSQPQNQQDSWLDKHCTDPDLIREVRSLLEADRKADSTGAGFLDPELARQIASAALDSEENSRPGDVIGQYRIIKPIARGGMGEVYRAERVGGTFEQQVALKVTRFSASSTHGRQRFFDEQGILARLEHPNIARLIDGGLWESPDITSNGRPYLVMEYVDGVRITQYCSAKKLDLVSRLKLFQTVCEAVDYAHRNLVVHRDLKPANILVSTEGQVKLLDFGVAKLLDEEVTGLDPQTRLMTPEYSAPEQLLGGTITTATDVYSLGLVLYELISEQRPFDFKGIAPAEAMRLITEVNPASPSSAAKALPWARQIKGDLDVIVAKALNKESERRYTSARALADDLQRFEKGLPIDARPDRWSYRAGKFIRRNRWETVAASLSVILLLTSTIAATFSARRAEQALSRAQVESVKSQQAVKFLSELFAAADPRQTEGETISVANVLDRGTARIEELANQPEVQATLLSELGRIHTTLGHYDQALAMLQRAAKLQLETLGPNEPALANTFHRWSIAADESGDLDSAVTQAKAALEIRQAALPSNHPDLGESFDRLGAALGGLGRYEEAEPFMRRAVRILNGSVGEQDNRSLTAQHNLAWLLGRLQRFEESEGVYREVVRISESLHGPNDPELLVTRDSLAVILRRQGKLDEAGSIYRDVLNRRIEVFGDSHSVVGVTRHNLARLLAERGQLEEARDQYTLALSNWETSLGSEHANLGVGYSNLGVVQEDLNETVAAAGSYSKSIAILEQHRPRMDQRLGDSNFRLGRLLAGRMECGSALAFLESAVKIREQNSQTATALAEARLELGGCLLSLDQLSAANKALDKAMEQFVTDPAAHSQELQRIRKMQSSLASVRMPSAD